MYKCVSFYFQTKQGKKLSKLIYCTVFVTKSAVPFYTCFNLVSVKVEKNNKKTVGYIMINTFGILHFY